MGAISRNCHTIDLLIWLVGHRSLTQSLEPNVAPLLDVVDAEVLFRRGFALASQRGLGVFACGIYVSYIGVTNRCVRVEILLFLQSLSLPVVASTVDHDHDLF